MAGSRHNAVERGRNGDGFGSSEREPPRCGGKRKPQTCRGHLRGRSGASLSLLEACVCTWGVIGAMVGRPFSSAEILECLRF